MACYLVSFEPVGPTASAAIRASLEPLPAYCPINAYCWAVLTDLTAVQLRDRLQAVAPSSRIFVVRSGTEAAWLNSYGPKNNEWLKKNL